MLSSPLVLFSLKELLADCRGHSSYINGAAFVKDGNQIVTVSSDGLAMLWDVKTAEVLHSFR